MAYSSSELRHLHSDFTINLISSLGEYIRVAARIIKFNGLVGLPIAGNLWQIWKRYPEQYRI